MKKLLLLFSIIAAACLFSGCATNPNGAKKSDQVLILEAIESVMPPNHTGYAKFAHNNGVFTIHIEADGLKRTADGWRWTWLTYNRTSSFTIGGVGWSSSGEITLGRKPLPVSAPEPTGDP